jgi:hypothetical protein
MNHTIPRRIIQIWGGGRELPLLARAAATNIRLLNPDFEYMLLDDGEMNKLIEGTFPQYKGVFDSFALPIQRYDFARYLAIYHYGGFYFDVDVFLASPLSELLEHSCVFPFEALTASKFLRAEYGMDWEVGNYAFGATAGHPFILAIIENCVRAQQDLDWAQAMVKSVPRPFRDGLYVLCTTGPLLVSRTLAEFPDASNYVKVLFPEDVRDPNSWSRFGQFGVHLMKGEWRDRRGWWRKRLFNAWESMIMKKMLKDSAGLGKNRSLEFGCNL